MAATLTIIYTICLVFIFFYSMVQLHLVVNYLRFHRRRRKNGSDARREIPVEDLPVVTVQLPIFNEMYVVERLIDNIARFDYPGEKLEIQVLDDSTDETLDISRRKVEEWREKGVDIKLVTRPGRTGFKAGALQHGMETARGEFIAIFDADFLPERDFLKCTLPYLLTDPRVGAVQTRWEHLNKDYSILTRIQAFALDAHFTVEQQGRNAGGYFINFNGTAGIWRQECIRDAGGWEADTLTEDLDLSYRAQLKGWKFKYLEDVGSPAELPVTMTAVKSQQFRWTKGGAETARKNISRIWKAPVKLGQKMHGTAHLLSSFVFIAVLLLALLSVPALMVQVTLPLYGKLYMLMSFFILSLISLGIFYYFSMHRRYPDILSCLGHFIPMFPVFLALSMGISLHNGIAALEGVLGFKSPFIRTPKFNVSAPNQSWKKNIYTRKTISLMTLFELFLAFYFLGGVFTGIYFSNYGMLPFHLMLFAGFGTVSFYTVRQTLWAMPTSSAA